MTKEALDKLNDQGTIADSNTTTPTKGNIKTKELNTQQRSKPPPAAKPIDPPTNSWWGLF